MVNRPSDGTVFTAYNPGSEDQSLPVIIPLKIQGISLWAYLDTGSGRNFISREAIEKLNLKPTCHESGQFVTINGVQKQSLPTFEVRLDSLYHRTSEQVEITGNKMTDFATVKELTTRYKHAQDKEFYVTASEEYHIHVILGDRTYCKIRTDQTFKERHIHFKLCKLMTMPVSPFGKQVPIMVTGFCVSKLDGFASEG